MLNLTSPANKVEPLLFPAEMLPMAVRVLHFGEDDCHRISILESAGYDVARCSSLHPLETQLQAESQCDAVLITESDGVSLGDAVAIARSHSLAPIVLFRTSNRRAPEKQFDLVVDSLQPPDDWLKEISQLIEKSRRFRAQSVRVIHDSEQLVRESAGVRRKSRHESARSRSESSRNSQKP